MALIAETNPARLSVALLLIFFAAFSYFAAVCVYRIYLHPLAKYPGPVLAKLTDLYSAYHSYINDVHIDMLGCHEQYGSIVRYGPNKIIWNSAKGFHDIYGHGKNVTKSTAYLALQSTNNVTSVLTSWDKKEHGRKRRYIAHGFTEAAVRGYEPMIKENIQILCTQLLESKHDRIGAPEARDAEQWSAPRNMAKWSSYFSFDIMTDVSFSQRRSLMTRSDNRFIINTINNMMHRTGVWSQMPWVKKYFLDRVFLRKEYLKAIEFKKEVEKIAMARIEKPQDGRRDAFQNILDAKDPETGQGLPLPETLGETGILVVAGSDTTSSALAAILFYLSRNNVVYTKLAHEIRTTFDSVEAIISGPPLRSCTYLRACIDEALRLSPPVSAAPWRVIQSGGANIDSERLPEGTVVGAGLYALHHNPQYFAHPFQFFPDRWIPSETNPQDRIDMAGKAFAPFLIGARMCAARNMAMTELLLAVAQIMFTMEFRVADGAQGKIGEGRIGMGMGREREEEFQLYSHFVTVTKDGPVLQFRKRVE